MFTKTELKWGVIFSVVQLLWLGLEYLVGLHDKFIAWHPYLTLIFAIPAVIMMVLAILEKRENLRGKITFAQAFLCGLGVSLVVAILSPLMQFIFHRIINPNFFTNMIKYAVDNQKATLEAAQSYFTLSSYMLQATIGALVMGIITTLVIAALIKKEVRNI